MLSQNAPKMVLHERTERLEVFLPSVMNPLGSLKYYGW